MPFSGKDVGAGYEWRKLKNTTAVRKTPATCLIYSWELTSKYHQRSGDSIVVSRSHVGTENGQWRKMAARPRVQVDGKIDFLSSVAQ